MKVVSVLFSLVMACIYALDRMERRAAGDRARRRLRRMRREAREGL